MYVISLTLSNRLRSNCACTYSCLYLPLATACYINVSLPNGIYLCTGNDNDKFECFFSRCWNLDTPDLNYTERSTDKSTVRAFDFDSTLCSLIYALSVFLNIRKFSFSKFVDASFPRGRILLVSSSRLKVVASNARFAIWPATLTGKFISRGPCVASAASTRVLSVRNEWRTPRWRFSLEANVGRAVFVNSIRFRRGA